MNYKSQLRGWAIDRTIELWKATGFKSGLDELFKHADDLAGYAYVAEEDFKDVCARLVALIKESKDPLDKVHALQNELLFIDEQIQAQLGRQINPTEKSKQTH